MINFCKKCLFPDTKPDLYFDEEGVCDACRSAEQKWEAAGGVDWEAREKEFEILLEGIDRSGLYDCVVPVSGGKDSVWQTYRAKAVHGLKPLAVTFDQFDQTPTGLNNLEVLKDIGVDHIHFTMNPNVVKRLVRKGLEEIGDPYWINHIGIFTVPQQVAQRFEIPLIIYGENPQFEYGGPPESRLPKPMDKRWRQEFGGLRGLREEDMIDAKISERDLNILKFPETGYESKGVFYGDYFVWDPITHTKVIKQIGWSELDAKPAGSYSRAENCDMKFIDLREQIKFLKFGYGRATDQLNIEIRSGNITRDEALKIVKEIDGAVDEENAVEFANYIGVTRAELADIIDGFVNMELFDRQGMTWTPKFERY